MLQSKVPSSSHSVGGVDNHFADTFLDAQSVRPAATSTIPDKNLNYSPSSTLPTPSTPFCLLSSNCNIFPSLSLSHRDKFQSDRCLTTTLHIQNLAADSQPSISSSDYSSKSSDHYSRPQDHIPQKHQGPISNTSNMPEPDKGSSLGKLRYSSKRNQPFQNHKDIRRTQSEAQVNKNKKSGNSLNSLKRAFSPFMFRGKKKHDKEEDDISTDHVMKKIPDRDNLVPIVMETGFPITAEKPLSPDGASQSISSGYVRGLVSPLVHPKNTLNLPSVPRGSLILEDSSRRSSIQTEDAESWSTLSRDSGTGLLVTSPSPPLPDRQENRTDSLISETAPRIFTSSITLPGSVNFSGDLSHVKETLVKPKAMRAVQIPGKVKKCRECNSPLSPSRRGEMENILKRYSPPKQTNISSASLQRKLKEIKKELEESESLVQGNQKIGEIRDKRNLDSRRLSSSELKDEVFYKKDEEVFDYTLTSPNPPAVAGEDDYYKEVEVRINPEGIAVVRRRHRALPETERGRDIMRRSTIHVDDRVFCDKAVLQSIYGHSPAHVSKRSSVDQEKFDAMATGVKLRPFVHQKSVPNLHASASDTEDCVIEMKDARETLVSTGPICKETDRLKREVHKSNASNLPIHKKYIRAYTKFYEQKLAVKLLDLNRFIKEEKETNALLDERIQRSLIENDKLLKELNSAKQDILNMIKVIEIPV